MRDSYEVLSSLTICIAALTQCTSAHVWQTDRRIELPQSQPQRYAYIRHSPEITSLRLELGKLRGFWSRMKVWTRQVKLIDSWRHIYLIASVT